MEWPWSAAWRRWRGRDSEVRKARELFAASREQALSVGDVLLRRTRLGLVAARAIRESGGEVPVQVARAMGADLGWDEARVAVEARRFDQEARSEYVPGDE